MITVQMEFEVPTTPKIKIAIKHYLRALASELPVVGEDGRAVGIGFHWTTSTPIPDKGFPAIVKIARFLIRAMTTEGIISKQATIYLLECRAEYDRDTHGMGAIRIKEG